MIFPWRECGVLKRGKHANVAPVFQKGEKYKKNTKIFDKFVQRAKRSYWYTKQKQIEELNDGKNPRRFWKEIANLGVGKERKKHIPCEIVNEDGSVSYDFNSVLTKWKSDFSTLLNPVAEQGNIHVDTTFFIEGDNSGNIDNNNFHVLIEILFLMKFL